MFSIIKEFKFEYAHKLNMDYDSPCKNIHGHSAKIFVEIWAEELNKNGMIIDFTHLKLFQDYLDKEFDHKTILNCNDDHINLINTDVTTIVVDPTSENLAKIFYIQIKEILEEKNIPFKKIKVTFFETAKNSASYEE